MSRSTQINSTSRGPAARNNWRHALPLLEGRRVILREFDAADAESLFEHLSDQRVQQFIDPSPATLEGFQTFIRWTHLSRLEGRYLSYGIVPSGERRPVGLLQLWPLEPGFVVAETGFALGSAYWGSGLFAESARLLFNFAFDVLGTRRIEMRAASPNCRGNAAIRKLGAVEEGVLRKCFTVQGRTVDHVLWSIVAEDWQGRSADAA